MPKDSQHVYCMAFKVGVMQIFFSTWLAQVQINLPNNAKHRHLLFSFVK